MKESETYVYNYTVQLFYFAENLKNLTFILEIQTFFPACLFMFRFSRSRILLQTGSSPSGPSIYLSLAYTESDHHCLWHTVHCTRVLYSTTRKLGCFVYTFLCVTDASSYACIVYLYTKILVNLKDGVLYSVQGLFAFLPFFPYNCILYGVLTLVCGYIHHFPIQKLTACN